MQNHVVLVDEYDQVHSDVLPFLSLVPSEFRRRVKALTADQALPWYKQSFELKVRDGAAATGQAAGEAPERRDSVLDLLAEFVDMLPDLELRVAKGDEPSVVVSGEARERHERLARAGKRASLSLPPSLFLLPPRAQSTKASTSTRARSPRPLVLVRDRRADRVHAARLALRAQLDRPPRCAGPHR